jgi:flavin reductase (DIM6/NTAB) family NADH-FMN oxidoreductase RutF
MTELDTREYRRTMGLFATGVTVLLTKTIEGEPIGMTANSLTSVSLDPMLLLVCVAKDAHIAPHLLITDSFTFSLLGEDQAAVSDYFAGMYRQLEPPDFEIVDWAGGLRLGVCMGAVGCKRYAVHDGGDHWIVVGRVIALDRMESPPDPLIFYSGKYRVLAEGEQDHL